MSGFILLGLQRTGFWVGAIFICAAMVVGGIKLYEFSTYVTTQATVTALTYKCDMSHRTLKLRAVHRVVECGTVPLVQQENSDISWSVDRVPFVEVAYTTPAGRPMRTTVMLSKLERTSVNIGDRFPILQSPEHPETITGNVNTDFLRLWGTMLGVGLVMFAGSFWIGSVRARRLRRINMPRAIALALEIPLQPGEHALRQLRERSRPISAQEEVRQN